MHAKAVAEYKLWNIAQEDKARKQITVLPLSFRCQVTCLAILRMMCSSYCLTLQEIVSLKGFVTEKIFLYKQHQAKRSELRAQNKRKNMHLMHLLAERSSQDALDAEEAGKEAMDSESETSSDRGTSSRMSESRKIDRLIYSEARKLLGEDGGQSDGSGSGRFGSSPSGSQKGESRYKPILGTLKASHDTVISYR